ncbi:MAG: 30S ribosomal protein S16 [Bdellovibrionota bacterium]
MVVIRLAPGGKKHNPVYRIHVADKDAKLRGRFLEKLGTYKPGKSGFFTINEERFSHWVSKGAQPSVTLKKLLKDSKKAAATTTA